MTLLQLRFHTFYKHLPWLFEIYNPVVIYGGHKMVGLPITFPCSRYFARLKCWPRGLITLKGSSTVQDGYIRLFSLQEEAEISAYPPIECSAVNPSDEVQIQPTPAAAEVLSL